MLIAHQTSKQNRRCHKHKERSTFVAVRSGVLFGFVFIDVEFMMKIANNNNKYPTMLD